HAEPLEFTLPPRSAAASLLEFSKQARVELLFSFDELSAVQSSAVAGRFEPAEALALLLQGTGFSAHRNGRGKFAVTKARPVTGGLTGRLLSPDGNPVAGAQVTIPEIRSTHLTDDHGVFTFTGLAPGLYRVLAGASGYRALEITHARVEASRTLRLETQSLQKSSDPTQLDPYIVHDKSGRDEAFDRSQTPLIPPTATGNLDLSRTENDAVPFTIFDRKQILRSGVVNLNEFLQREVLEGDPSVRSPEQDGSQDSFVAGSTNLNLRGYGSDETVILVNGRRLPEILTIGSSALPPDVSLIPVSLVEQIEVLPVSASALYSGNPVGGVINIVLRPNQDITELTATYTNALASYDAPQISVSLQDGQTLLHGALRVRLSATYTHSQPATEAELGYIQRTPSQVVPLASPVFRATPNIRSVNQDMPLFSGSSAPVTSVVPGADGAGGLAAFAGREGVRNFALFGTLGGTAASTNSRDYPYGREQRRASYFFSTTYDFSPSLQVGADFTYAHTVVNRGFDVMPADLGLAADSPFNPFHQDARVSLNEIAPRLGKNYNEARLDFFSVVAGALLKLPADWQVSADSQYARNVTRYRGLGGADPARWQQLVDAGIYNPLRDTQAFGPPPEFYDRVLTYRGGRGKFVTLGDYDTLDAALRLSNRSLSLPTGSSILNVGADYRRTHFSDYLDERLYADGSPASAPTPWKGRTLQRVSVFGEIQAPLLPAHRLPAWIDALEGDLAARYIVADTSRETNIAPTIGLKVDFRGGFSMRGSFTTSNRVPTPQMSLPVAQPGGIPGVNYSNIYDPVKKEYYDVQADEAPAPNLRPEEAVTQTAGLVFKRGKRHHLRAALDFVDTRKTNEVTVLGAQDVVNLEAVFPERVTRAPAPDGRLTHLTTGAVNVASRHSQNWTASVDYSHAGVLGGTFEAYARLLYFQRYDVQIYPTSPAVDELRHPDTPAFGLLKYRANFGAGWSRDEFGFGVDGHYFYSRVLPLLQQPAQQADRIGSHEQFDAYLQGELGRWLPWRNSRRGLRGQIRVNNVFGTEFPRYLGGGSGVGVQPYGDWRGRTYSLSLTATF
ncbi:MAG: btuB 2, partial [Verrucomicrobia bacterium]|nr:btuB 2 [Verrucomicrobiota bacterium]